MKKLILLPLAALLLGAANANAQNGGPWNCGTNATATLVNSVLTISGTGAMNDYSAYNGAPWYSYRTQIAQVVIEEGITRIGNGAFWIENRTIDIMTLPSSVTSIGNAFGYMTLRNLIIESNTQVSYTNNNNQFGMGVNHVFHNMTAPCLYVKCGLEGSYRNNSSWTSPTCVKSPSYYTIIYRNNYTIDGTSGSRLSATCDTCSSPCTAAAANSFTRPSYIFRNWNTKTDGSGTTYRAGARLRANLVSRGDTLNLYARWGYIVTYNGNGNTGGSMVADTFYNDVNSTLHACTFTKTSYTFGGWASSQANANAGTMWYADGASVANLGNTTLYAIWKAGYTVTFDSQGGSSVSSQSVNYNAKATKPNPDPTYTGYTFGGWYKEQACTNAYDFNTIVTANITLYAKWTINTYTVAYNKNATDATGTTASSSHTYGTAKALTANGYSRTGYTFGGWNTNAAGTGTSYTNSQSVSNLTSTNGATVTLYAVWTANTYTVTFNAQGGSAVSQQEVNSGSTATEPPVPTRAGFTFLGWYKEQACINAYDFNTAVTAAITLYAKWKLDANGSCTEGMEFVIKIPFRQLPDDVTAVYRWYRNGEFFSDGTATAEDTHITCTIPASEAYGVNVEFYFEYTLHDNHFGIWTHSPRYTITFLPPVQ